MSRTLFRRTILTHKHVEKINCRLYKGLQRIVSVIFLKMNRPHIRSAELRSLLPSSILTRRIMHFITVGCRMDTCVLRWEQERRAGTALTVAVKTVLVSTFQTPTAGRSRVQMRDVLPWRKYLFQCNYKMDICRLSLLNCPTFILINTSLKVV